MFIQCLFTSSLFVQNIYIMEDSSNDQDGLLNLSRALELPPILKSHERHPKEVVVARCGDCGGEGQITSGGGGGGGGEEEEGKPSSTTTTATPPPPLATNPTVHNNSINNETSSNNSSLSDQSTRRKHSATSLSRTLSASSVLNNSNSRTQQQRQVSSSSAFINPPILDLHKMASLDEIKQGSHNFTASSNGNSNNHGLANSTASVFSSSTSSSSNNNNKNGGYLEVSRNNNASMNNTNMINNSTQYGDESSSSCQTSPMDESFVITYKPDPLVSSYGRTSSRYYEKMSSTRPWIPTYNKKQQQQQESTTPPESPEMMPASVQKQFQPNRTSSFPTSSKIKLTRSQSSSWSTPTQKQQQQQQNMFKPQQQQQQPPLSSPGSGSIYNNNNNSKNNNIHDNEDEDYESKLWQEAVPPLSLYEHVPRMFGIEPPKISGHCSALIKEKIYFFGGKLGDEDRLSNSLYVFNCLTNTLSKPKIFGDIPPPLCDISATKVGTKFIYFFGGQDEDKNCTNDLYVLNIINFKFTKLKLDGRRPPTRRGHSAIHYGNTLYVFGGFSQYQEPLNDIWKLDLTYLGSAGFAYGSEVLSLEKDTDHWPTERGYHTAHYAPPKTAIPEGVNPMMVIYGGNSLTEVFDEVWFFDMVVEKWQWLGPTQIKCDDTTATTKRDYGIDDDSEDLSPTDVAFPRPPNTPPPPMCCRTLHTSELSGKYLITYGGHNGSTFMNTLDVLNLQTRRWKIRSCYGFKTPGPCSHIGAIYDSRYFTIGGFDMNQILTGIKVIEMPLFPVFSPQ